MAQESGFDVMTIGGMGGNPGQALNSATNDFQEWLTNNPNVDPVAITSTFLPQTDEHYIYFITMVYKTKVAR